MFGRKKRKPITVVEVSGDDLMNRFLLDCRVPFSQALSLTLGLTPMEDPDEEVALSKERVARASIAVPLMATFSEGLAYAMVEYVRTHDHEDTFTDEQAAVMRVLLESMGMSCALGTITQLEDLGLISYVWSDK
jgi:hypothetical protein